MGLFHKVVAARSGDDLDVLHGVEHREVPNRRPIAPELVRVNDLRNVILAEEAHEKRLGCFGIAVFLKENVQHIPVFVDRSPQPVFDPADLDAHLVQMPPGTATRFSVAEFFGEERSKFDVPLPQGLVADLNTALVEQFLNIPLAEWEAVIEPQGVADDAEGKTVAVRFPVGHNSAAYWS